MIFQLTTETECELTSFTGRTQKSGRDDLPAVTFRFKLASVQNTLLDQFSPTFRHTAYMAVEGQEQLEGIEPTTPILRSKDLKHWTCETVHEGWTVTVARGITDASALTMGSCKLDAFAFELYEGGSVDLEFRVSTADVDEEGAGMLWGRQKRKVHVMIQAPEMPAAGATEATGAKIDGSAEAFKADHPGFFQGDPDAPTPEDALAHSLGDPDEHDEEDEGAAPDLEAEREQAELEAGMAASIQAAGVAPKGRRGRKAVGAVE